MSRARASVRHIWTETQNWNLGSGPKSGISGFEQVVGWSEYDLQVTQVVH
jgi:hypothetical protein